MNLRFHMLHHINKVRKRLISFSRWFQTQEQRQCTYFDSSLKVLYYCRIRYVEKLFFSVVVLNLMR